MGEKLKALLAERKWTVYRLSQETGLSTGHLHDLVSGKYEPGMDTLRTLAAGFGVKLKDLLD